MSLRGVVTGTDACTTSDGVGASNPLSRLADAVLTVGSRGPREHGGGAAGGQGLRAVSKGPLGDLAALRRAVEAASQPNSTDSDGTAFQPITDADVDAFARQHGPAPPPRAPEPALQGNLHAFMRSCTEPSAAAAIDSAAQRPVASALPPAQQRVLRDRASILARQIFADQGPAFADRMVSSLLRSVGVDESAVDRAQMEAAWHDAQRGPQRRPLPPGLTSYASERLAPPPDMNRLSAWARDFERRMADQHAQLQSTAAPATRAPDAPAPEAAASEQEQVAADHDGALRDASRALEAQLASSGAATAGGGGSRFLQFVSKMSRGELLVRGNEVVERGSGEAARLDEAGGFGEGSAMERWAEEFAGGVRVPVAGDEVDEWAREFQRSAAQEFGSEHGGTGDEQLTEQWAQEFLSQLDTRTAPPAPYPFREDNAFKDKHDALALGRALYERGLLTEAALAVEAAIQDAPLVEAWRLLGAICAENDDDQRAIAAMLEALKLAPTDPEVLLSLGVSYTNELDPKDALGHLRAWLRSHPVHGPACRAALDAAAASDYGVAETADVFAAAAAAAPGDADVRVALGVAWNLARDFHAAVVAFREALEISPGDYSLWNKLGATQANSGESAAALQAYQRALDLKPNYVRAWVNMGIAHGNLGKYDEAARYYVRALQMNPDAGAVWGYLRSALACAGKFDLLDAADARNVAPLSEALPLG
ncbi:unnamed protein product [Pedinophyceae sp. YPF-701]|nr:unnamed protein product [Pedinophyceae sp. YPF-701]